MSEPRRMAVQQYPVRYSYATSGARPRILALKFCAQALTFGPFTVRLIPAMLPFLTCSALPEACYARKVHVWSQIAALRRCKNDFQDLVLNANSPTTASTLLVASPIRYKCSEKAERRTEPDLPNLARLLLRMRVAVQPSFSTSFMRRRRGAPRAVYTPTHH